MKKRSRSLTVVAGVAAIVLTISACASDKSSSSSGGSGSSSGTIKVGVVLPFSGVQATIAGLEGQGVQTAIDEINAKGGIKGQKLEMVKADDQLSATQAATVMRDLNSKGVKLAVGGQTSDLCKAEAQAANRFGIIFIGAHCTSKTLVNPPVSPNFWMTGQLDTDLTRANGQALAALFPNVQTWDVFAYDQSVTRGFWTQTRDEISKVTGKEVVTNKEVYVPATATDFKTQLSAIASSQTGTKETRGLFLGVYGAGTTSFIQQARPLGLLDDYAVMAQTGVYWSTAVSLKGTAPPIYDVHEYFYSCQNNPTNTAFIADFKKVAGQLPDTGAYQGYMAIEMLSAAIAKAGSGDPTAVGKAMPGISAMTPTGETMTMDGTSHHADGPITTALLSGDTSAPENVSVTDCKTVLSSAIK
ncbi:amino acid/amide ABC transporter substrate-binding protein (HAAT family) [Jatrophihabitans sp. GAS493]|uniref:ABC transporter substrate-binding protein n=1 Tax=Jatrophihabitans sp. GAS493 TaxID=1907575 RepID=UPI000BB91D00|nr:ABC transporter substrate-binding protein [Jatrophihabitans sp. GAS493]SOD74669.1 amino acid/amide ABC transporter substrate-binding protein (HAAT family) [Jatrophihabitans sp. GAS493]